MITMYTLNRVTMLFQACLQFLYELSYYDPGFVFVKGTMLETEP